MICNQLSCDGFVDLFGCCSAVSASLRPAVPASGQSAFTKGLWSNFATCCFQVCSSSRPGTFCYRRSCDARLAGLCSCSLTVQPCAVLCLEQENALLSPVRTPNKNKNKTAVELEAGPDDLKRLATPTRSPARSPLGELHKNQVPQRSTLCSPARCCALMLVFVFSYFRCTKTAPLPFRQPKPRRWDRLCARLWHW